MTLGLSLASLALSLILGMLSAAGQSSPILPIRYFCSIYVKFIRGTPLIMQIYLFFYIVGTAWGVSSRFLAGVLILSIFEGAYIAEIIRGSLLSLDQSQLEAARAVGFTKKQAWRFVILPQMVARTDRAVCFHYQGFLPAVCHCGYRTDTVHAGDQRRELPAL